MPPEFWVPLVVGLALFLTLWPVSILKRDVSIVDFVWGPGFALQLGVALYVAAAFGERAVLVLVLVVVWSVRLGWTLIRRRLREGHEDPRYASIRKSWGAGFWWKSVFIVFALQAGIQWLIASGAIAGATSASQGLGVVAAVGALISVSGLVLETVADSQLDRFKREQQAGGLMTTGLRGHVRHPNYAGEVLFWCGIALIGLDGGVWLSAISPILVTVFLVKVSGIPLLDERLSETRPGYAEYRRKTPAFVPSIIAVRQILGSGIR